MSFATALITALITIVMPVINIAHNPLLGALFGGLLTGIGVGMTMRYGFSTAGLDIVVLVLERATGKTVGSLMFMTNLIIIVLSGVLFSWEHTLLTVISIYACTRMVDVIHTGHKKLTALIVTSQTRPVIAAIQRTTLRGVTIIPSKGAYSGADNTTLMVVISRYELYSLQRAIDEVDQQAFINILDTVDTGGYFLSEQGQAEQRQALQKS